MKREYTLKRLAPVVLLVCALIATAACGNSKKYGCPNHLKANVQLN